MGQNNIVTGSVYALAAFFCMAVFGILTKIALAHGSVIWISFIAYLTGTVILGIFIAPKGLQYLRSDRYAYLIARAVFGCIASFLYTISINYIPIVNGTLLFNTAPIFIPILALLWLKVPVERSIWLAVAIGFLGIIVIIKPTWAIFTDKGNFVALASGLCLAIAYLLMKLLTATDPGIRIIFYYLGIGMLIQFPLLAFAGPSPNSLGIGYAALSGIVLVIAQVALVNGYKYAEASQIGIYQYTSVVFVGLLDWMLWGVIPGLWDLLGVFLVAAAGMVIIRGNSLKHHSVKKK
jgi:drug/metabolite transporter (DMT)-like permease